MRLAAGVPVEDGALWFLGGGVARSESTSGFELPEVFVGLR